CIDEICIEPVCGDGIVSPGVEDCDAGAPEGGNGCTSTCTYEPVCVVTRDSDTGAVFQEDVILRSFSIGAGGVPALVDQEVLVDSLGAPYPRTRALVACGGYVYAAAGPSSAIVGIEVGADGTLGDALPPVPLSGISGFACDGDGHLFAGTVSGGDVRLYAYDVAEDGALTAGTPASIEFDYNQTAQAARIVHHPEAAIVYVANSPVDVDDEVYISVVEHSAGTLSTPTPLFEDFGTFGGLRRMAVDSAENTLLFHNVAENSNSRTATCSGHRPLSQSGDAFDGGVAVSCSGIWSDTRSEARFADGALFFSDDSGMWSIAPAGGGLMELEDKVPANGEAPVLAIAHPDLMAVATRNTLETMREIPGRGGPSLETVASLDAPTVKREAMVVVPCPDAR
ncbi:MAG: hypothetical protein AAF721_37675, partial [Myxococcota bacterium]